MTCLGHGQKIEKMQNRLELKFSAHWSELPLGKGVKHAEHVLDQ
jgi:hypothetical protein